MGDEDRLASLARANTHRHEATRTKARTAIDQMLARQQRITINSVARTAGVSRTFLYTQDDLLTEIRKLAGEDSHRMPRPKRPSSEESLRARLAVALDEVRSLKEGNRELRLTIERLTAEIVRLESS